METNDAIILGGAVLAVVLGIMRTSKEIGNVVLLLVAIWPCFMLGLKNGWNFLTVAIAATIIYAVFLGLRWAGNRFGPKNTPSTPPSH